MKQATTRAITILIYCLDTSTFYISDENTPYARVTLAQGVLGFSWAFACFENLKQGQESYCLNGCAVLCQLVLYCVLFRRE